MKTRQLIRWITGLINKGKRTMSKFDLLLSLLERMTIREMQKKQHPKNYKMIRSNQPKEKQPYQPCQEARPVKPKPKRTAVLRAKKKARLQRR